jgi:tripartite-type tricarboxylate transporter receptor subunit TctC
MRDIAGTTIHLSGELFNMMTGVKMVHVPYRGNAPALTDLIAGQVQMMFADTPSSIEHVKSGKLRALAVATAARSEILPELPTVSEFLPGFQASIGSGRRTKEHTARNYRQAEQGDKRCSRRPQDKSAARRFGCSAACGLARRFRKIHRR